MNSIQIHGYESSQFLTFIGNLLQNNASSDVNTYNITVDPDETSTLLPAAPSDFHIKWQNETFQISLKEEGKPTGEPPRYFKRLNVQHTDLTLLKNFVTSALTWKKPLDHQKIKLFSSSGKGYWEMRESVYAQSINNIFIPEQVKASMMNHIDKFLSQKDRYVDAGRAYKLTMLLTGVPGSGKTSIVKAIALKYGRPVYALNFTKMLTDDSFISLVDDIRDDSILLIEDIDAFFFDRKPQDINISFSAVINVLDGVMSKGNGLLIFITANNPDRLDPALIRPGRVDKMIKFDYPKKKEVQAAFTKLTDGTDGTFDEFYRHIVDMRMTMSAIIDYLFRNASTYIQNIDELVQQTKLYHEIINDKTDKLYA